VSIGSNGLEEVRTIRISQYFQQTNTNATQKRHGASSLRDAFTSPPVVSGTHTHTPKNTHPSTIAVTITDVAWGSPSSSSGGGGRRRRLSFTGRDGGGELAGGGSGGGVSSSSSANNSQRHNRHSSFSFDAGNGGGGGVGINRKHKYDRGMRNDSFANDDSQHSVTSRIGYHNQRPHQHQPHHQQDAFESLFAIPVEEDSNFAGTTNIHHQHQQIRDDSLIAAAGSNGAVVIWRASDLFVGAHPTITQSQQQHTTDAANRTARDKNRGRMFSHYGYVPPTQPNNNNSNTTTTTNDPLSSSSTSTKGSVRPPDILVMEHEHSMAVNRLPVNRLAWHPKRSGLLLTASQDGSAILWERRITKKTIPSSPTDEPPNEPPTTNSKGGLRSWFGSATHTPSTKSHSRTHKNTPTPNNNNNEDAFTWYNKAKFDPKCGAILDIKWSICGGHDDILAMVTNNGFLVVYDARVVIRAMVRIAAHARDATTLDWHPTRPYIIATGGVDKTVKVWDLESYFTFNRINEDNLTPEINMKFNSYSSRSAHSTDGAAGESSPSSKSESGLDCIGHNYSNHGGLGLQSSLPFVPSMKSYNNNNSNIKRTPVISHLLGPTSSLGSNTSMRSHKNNAASKYIHELSISAQVQCLKWRPPTSTIIGVIDDDVLGVDHHDAMLAVATAPMNTSGGYGSVCLWSYHRPFMPLSVVEGHVEGAVTDFLWLDTPDIDDGEQQNEVAALPYEMHENHYHQHQHTWMEPTKSGDGPGTANHQDRRRATLNTLSGTWQHILSVGKDGQCLLQTFARGERPIFQVPSSTFAIANLSPFQKGYGSLQLVSVHQNVPSGHDNDYLLSGLRSDELTSRAPGVFKEVPPTCKQHEDCLPGDTSHDKDKNNKSLFVWEPKPGGQREPSTQIKMKFSATDSGTLDKKLLSSRDNHDKNDDDEVLISPEVVHLSRFAESYRLYKDASVVPTKAAICRHNAVVAKKLNCRAHGRMWNMLALLLEGSGSEDISDLSSTKRAFATNAMAYALLPTLKSLLFERADAGDIQTCVVLCEVMEVIPMQQQTMNNTQQQTAKTTIPGLDYMLVREWYLSYIELLQQMCLFSHATDLIRHCRDPEVGKLNQQSTTIHESCPVCYKPLPTNTGSASLRACKSCRQRVGLCFLCHEPVKGMFVWCPGCGHGGHLEHALEWFSAHEVCPTGCGHKCNFVQHSSASSFPRTASLMKIDLR